MVFIAGSTIHSIPTSHQGGSCFLLFHFRQIWKIEQESKELILLDKFGHFDSDHCYLIEFYHSGRHELYLWVGSLVKWDEVNVNAMDVVTTHIKEASGLCQLVSVHTGQTAVNV